MQLEVLKIDGSKTGEKVELSPAIFEIKPNDQAIYQAVTAYLANARQGTHKTKTRGEVRGGGKKPWKQKHTGRARSGSIRNPIWVGGGTIFGPQPHDYEKKVNDKVKILAKKSALSYKAKDTGLMVVEDFTLEESKTKRVVEILNSLGLKGKKVLVLLPKGDKKIFLAARNMQKVFVKDAVGASVYEILNNDVVLFQRSALTALQDKMVGVTK
ncbi:MAG TPA: 50S ribosomal protein L4 [Candidatus Kryptobacter bacterium]|nr:MAG: 50S ribosomal protein L4 [Ignavibacteriae bacterium 37-53-5]HQT92218.1 50S ribosomal protein L4 [Candidatus Kryptobacter bacterium]